MNHKAVFLNSLILLLFAFVWAMAAPSSLVQYDDLDPVVILLFILAIITYVYFNAWLLMRTRFVRFVDGFLLIMGIWIFSILPNIIFIHVFLTVPPDSLIYLCIYGFLAATMTALILPLWRTSRSIFKS